MRKTFLLFILLFGLTRARAQELYVFTEPASNMPANSIGAKLTGNFVNDDSMYGRLGQRYMPEIMFGISKKFMVHLSGTFSNMHTKNFKAESWAVYAKYRFLSKDDIHKHFRMAAFVDFSGTSAAFHYDEISLKGDKTGIEGGIIATQLWNKLAVSATLSNTQLLDDSRFYKDVIFLPERNFQSMNYSVSAGYLLLPREYTDYKQLNLNLYLELLAQQALDVKTHYIDLAPAVQIIFNSNAKLNLGHRFQLDGNMERMARGSWLISFERTFLNALSLKSKK